MNWLSKHAEAIEALAAVGTLIIAAAALIGVKLQLDTADRLSREQSAREAYRAHLALSATQNSFAGPKDACSLLQSQEAWAYTAFVGHLMYAAEQMLAVSEGWDETFLTELSAHKIYICSADGPVGDIPETRRLLSQFRAETCPSVPLCD